MESWSQYRTRAHGLRRKENTHRIMVERRNELIHARRCGAHVPEAKLWAKAHSPRNCAYAHQVMTRDEKRELKPERFKD